jgi:CBS domain-containing membrane protein
VKHPTPHDSGPQHGFLFRFIAFVSRIQLGNQLRLKGNPGIYVAIFAIFTGAVALGTITAVAVLTHLPLLFPPLAPSAIILFYTPMSAQASPRSVVISHFLAAIVALISITLFACLFPLAGIKNPSVMNWPQILVIVTSMGGVTALMILLRCVHPPAGATALLVSLGYIVTPVQILSLLASVVLLVIEAILINRLIGGLPYPYWRYNPETVASYRALAGQADSANDGWRDLAANILNRY